MGGCAREDVTVEFFPYCVVENGKAREMAFVSAFAAPTPFRSRDTYLVELTSEEKARLAKRTASGPQSGIFPGGEVKRWLDGLPEYRFPALLQNRLSHPTWGVWSELGYVVQTEPLMLAYPSDVGAFEIASRRAAALSPTTTQPSAGLTRDSQRRRTLPIRRTFKPSQSPNFVEPQALDVVVDTVVVVDHQKHEKTAWPLRPASHVFKLRSEATIAELLAHLAMDRTLEGLASAKLEFP